MNTKVTRFKDRRHAGRLLAAALSEYTGREDVIAPGLPRGGVPVAFEVARKLGVPLDVIVARKLGVPGWEELAMDDGIATGSTILAAVNVLRQQGPAAIVIAVPTTSADAFELLNSKVDEFVSLMIPPEFHAVGQWNDDFTQTTDADVRALPAGAATHNRDPRKLEFRKN